MTKTVAVRLEGGIGDHVLGLRIMPFIRRAFPHHHIIAYSDAGGYPSQLEITRMCPHVAEVYPVYKDPARIHPEHFDPQHGLLSQLRDEDQARLRSHDQFFDAWGKWFFIPQSKALQVPFYEILNSKPTVVVPETGRRMLADSPYGQGEIYVAMSLSKFGARVLKQHYRWIQEFLRELVSREPVTILNLFTTNYDFPHWPAAMRSGRVKNMKEESAMIEGLCEIDPKIVAVRDAPMPYVCALIQRAAYFIGADNGLKHIAWAMNVPLTNLIEKVPDELSIARWLVDFHRALVLQSNREEIDRHLTDAQTAIRAARWRAPALPAIVLTGGV